MTKQFFVLVFASLAAACGSAGGGDVDAAITADANVTSDAALAADANVAVDATATGDANVAVDGGGDAQSVVDANTAADASAATDAALDAVAPDFGTLPPSRRGQCFTNAHCGPSRTCTATTPGGFCDCGSSCSVGPADECSLATCHESCTTTADCTPGLRCNTTAGICVLRSCETSAVCGDHHACRDGFCRRIPCDAGCPSGTTCRATSNGMLCVEDDLAFE